MPRILCLHTADVHIGTFSKLYAAMAPDVQITNTVRADWLADARRDGLTDPLRADVTAFLRASASQHDAVLCTCSTLGPIAGATHTGTPNIIRIDTPLMLKAAAHTGTVLVAFCLESTRAPTLELLDATYRRLGKQPRFETVLCAEAWPRFERNDSQGFAQSVATSVRRAAEAIPDLACIVLAQASMAVAAPHLADVSVPVYSSPRLAVEATLQVVMARANSGSR